MTDYNLKRDIWLPCLILKLTIWLMRLNLKTEHSAWCDWACNWTCDCRYWV